MAEVKTPYENVGKAPVRKHRKSTYCLLCRRSYRNHEAQEHMHGMLHHRELERVQGKDSFHECQACEEFTMGLKDYAQHVSTAKHKAQLRSLISKNVKPVPLWKTLNREIMDQIQERNKTCKNKKKAVRKRKKKKKKKLQAAGQTCAETLPGASRKNTVVSKVVMLEKSKQVNMRTLEQMHEIHQGGNNSAVVQNKENKVSKLQRPPHQRESTLQNQDGKLPCLSREPPGRTWHHPYDWDQFKQPAHQLRHDFPADQCSKVETERSQTDALVRRPHNIQRGAANTPEQTTWPAVSQHDYYNNRYDTGEDFTSDHLPQNDAIIFDHGHNESTEQAGSRCLPQPASSTAPPIRDNDVSAMLWQIRRALGVREPCRADREARRQSSKAGARAADQAGAEREQPAGGSYRNYTYDATTSAHTSHSSVCPSSTAPAKPNNMTQGTTQHGEMSSVVASDSNGPSNSWEREFQGALDSQAPLSQCSGRTASSEPNPNISRKIRIAHKPGVGQVGKEAALKPTLNKLFSLSGPKSKLNWREKYEEMKRKKQECVKGRPRFGIELAKPLSDQGTSAQSEDLPLSEGFQWESVPAPCATRAHCTGLPPPPQDTTNNDSHTETQSVSQTQESMEQPGAAQEGCSSQTIKTVSVKVEPKSEDENGDLSDHSRAKKRKHNVMTHDDVSGKEQRGKKKKIKSNKGRVRMACPSDQEQMNQLLAVSLREEELSQSLQDLDNSLVEARNALQAAYTEVQRLLLLKQQCTTEVNSLRAKRIEILQGMQGGYLGASNVAGKAITSSAAAMQPRLSPLPSSSAFPTSSSPQTPPTNPASSVSQPHPTPVSLPAIPVKQGISQSPAVSCSPDTAKVPANPPVPLFPPDLLPPLLLPLPCLAAPTAAVSSLKQLKAVCSASENPSPESPARQLEQVTKDDSKDYEKTAMIASEEADGDSEEETGGNPVLAAEKPASTLVPERDQNASAAAPDDNGGNKSDNSVKMMEPSNQDVIDVDESDNEEIVANVPVHQEPPQKSASEEFSSASTQTFQQPDVERKAQSTPVPVKEATAPAECVEELKDEELSLGAFVNHTGPVHSLHVHEGLLYTCSGDNTARAYSLTNKECLTVFTGHTSKVNCLLVSSVPNMLARLFTGSSDQTIRCYSLKSTKCLEQISLSDRVLCLHMAWNILFAGLADGSVASYDLKTLKQIDVFECHGPRGVSCLGTAQEGARRVLLVGSYDSTISVRDAKSGLLLRSLKGHTKTVLCMKVVNDLVFSGSSDMSVHAHNIHTGELVRIYKGHSHAVTSIVILGKVMVTACLDKLIRVYELQSHDRLQVYGGHSDMVMCMTVHKSVIYTGCYDGSIQAVKLNLTKNFRCWWQNCSLIFGMAEHLVQHLIRDHTNPNLQMVKCRWRGCSTFFARQQTVREELPDHMQRHVQSDSEVLP